MTSYARHREHYVPNVGSGRYFHPALGSWVTVSVTGTNKKVCDDVVGNWKADNGLFIEQTRTNQVLLEGRSPSGYIYARVPTTAAAFAPPAHALNALITAGELSPLSVKLLAKANPNAPKVLLPAFVGEMRELPGLIRSFGLQKLKDLPSGINKWFLNEATHHFDVGGTPGLAGANHRVFKTRPLDSSKLKFLWENPQIPLSNWMKGIYSRMAERFGKDLAQKYIEYRWALRPAVSDITNILGFQKYALERMKVVQDLCNGGSVRKSVSLGTESVSSQLITTTIWSTGGYLETGGRNQITSRKTWGTVRYTISKSLFPWQRVPVDPRGANLLRDAQLAVLGMTWESLSLSAWELLPWSWLVDTFTNFGELLSLTNNRIPVEHSGMVLCRRTTTRQIAGLKVVTSGLIPRGQFLLERDTKVRAAGVIGLPLQVSYLPLFEASKIAILGSLVTVRRG